MKTVVHLFAVLLLCLMINPALSLAQDQPAPEEPAEIVYDENGQPITVTPPEAINQYSDRYKSNTNPVYYSGQAIPPGVYSLFLITPDAADPDTVILRLTSNTSVTGCANVTPPTVKQTVKGPNLWLEITDSAVEIDRSVRYAHFQCNTGRQYAGTDIVLNRTQLLADGISKIALRSPLGTDFYDVEIGDHSIHLSPKSQKYFKPLYASNRPDPLTYWFYPTNTVVLSVLDEPQNLNEAITDFAQGLGLVPLESMIPDFMPRLPTANTLYFTAPDDARITLPDAGQNLTLGQIEAPRTFYGSGGTYQKPTQVAVFARRPGLED